MFYNLNYGAPYITTIPWIIPNHIYTLPDHGNTKTIYIPKPYNEPFYIYIHIEEEPFHVKITPITIPWKYSQPPSPSNKPYILWETPCRTITIYTYIQSLYIGILL